MNLIVFASGTGSNAKNIFELAQKYPNMLSVQALICNKPEAGVLDIAKFFGIPSHVVVVEKQRTPQDTRQQHEQKIIAILDTFQFDYICLAGYMRIFSAEFIQKYPHPIWPVSKIINIHPSLLPSFKGMLGYKNAFDYGVKISGVTTHFVNAEVDGGTILHQRIFERHPDDTLQTFVNRGMEQEYICYRQTLLALAQQTEQISSYQHVVARFLSTARDE